MSPSTAPSCWSSANAIRAGRCSPGGSPPWKRQTLDASARPDPWPMPCGWAGSGSTGGRGSSGVLTIATVSTPSCASLSRVMARPAICRRQKGQCRPRNKPTMTGLLPAIVVEGHGAIVVHGRQLEVRCGIARLQGWSGATVMSCFLLVALLRQPINGELTLERAAPSAHRGPGPRAHTYPWLYACSARPVRIVEVEVQSGETVVTGKHQLRLSGLLGKRHGFRIVTQRRVGSP